MRKLLVVAAVLALCAPLAAHATTLNFGTFTLTVPSTGATCTLPTTMTAPLAANTQICQVVVTPTGWVGTIANPTGGADSSKFAIVAVSGQSWLENNVALPVNGSAAGNNTYAIGSSVITP